MENRRLKTKGRKPGKGTRRFRGFPRGVFRPLLSVLLWLHVGGAQAVADDPCPGIPSETAKRLFDLMTNTAVGEGYSLDGVGTKHSEMEILWSLNGEKCPVIRIHVENCGTSADLATLALTVPADLLTRCPNLRAAVRVLTEAIAKEHPAAQGPVKPPPPWPLLAAVLTVGLATTIAVVRLLLLMTGKGAGHRRWSSPLTRAAWVMLPPLVLYVAAELGYRVMIWSLTEHTSEHSFVVYGVGESTMAGEPFDDRMSLVSLVSEMLDQHIGERAVAVRNVAERGKGAYAQSLRFEQELIYRDPSAHAAALIYVGHNEPYLDDDGEVPAATQDEIRGSWLARLVRGRPGILIKHTWLLRDALLYIRSLHFLWPQADAQRYEWSVRRMIEVASDNGVTPILFTLPSNISGVEPNAYEKEAPGVAAILERGATHEHSGDYGAALAVYGESYLSAVPKSDTALLLLYRIARCEMALERYDDARRDFWAVVNQDRRRNFGRATVAQNDLIRRLAAEYKVPLVDGVEEFERASPHAILGDELFSDGHHPSLRGYLVLAAAGAAQLAESFHGQLHSITSEDEVRNRFGIGPAEMGRVHIASGSWLIATAGYHPWPMDRLARAEAHFRAAAGSGDDFSVWFGVALAQAGRKGFLRSEDNLTRLAEGKVYYSKSLRVPAQHRDYLIGQFRNYGVEKSVVEHLEAVWP